MKFSDCHYSLFRFTEDAYLCKC